MTLFLLFAVDGGWGSWSDWGACSVTCEEGVASRSRSCDNPVPAFNGSSCIGNATGENMCTEKNCPSMYLNMNCLFSIATSYTCVNQYHNS